MTKNTYNKYTGTVSSNGNISCQCGCIFDDPSFKGIKSLSECNYCKDDRKQAIKNKTNEFILSKMNKNKFRRF